MLWHKKEKEHILNVLGIQVEYGEPIDYGENKGTFKMLGDYEHAAIIEDYISDVGGMGKIAQAHGVSSGTVYNHLKRHNEMIEKQGECDMCRHRFLQSMRNVISYALETTGWLGFIRAQKLSNNSGYINRFPSPLLPFSLFLVFFSISSRHFTSFSNNLS